MVQLQVHLLRSMPVSCRLPLDIMAQVPPAPSRMGYRNI